MPTQTLGAVATGAGFVALATAPAHRATGQLYLNKNEDAELNTHLPNARDTRIASGVANAIARLL